MKTINITLDRELKSLEVIPLADLHYGDPLCDVEWIKEKINYIKSRDNVYCILNGDLINNTTRTSVGDVYSERKKPQQQIQELCELFRPIKDKILAICPGNHEMRTYKTDGIDLTRLFCFNLDIEDKYSEDATFLFLRFGQLSSHFMNRQVRYTFYITHGNGGGSKEGSKINKLVEMAGIIDADIYIHSHTHLPAIVKESFFRVSTSKNSITQVPKLYINTGASLNYGGYGEISSMKPMAKETPHIWLDGTEPKMKATL